MGIFTKTSLALAAALSICSMQSASAATSTSSAFGARVNLNANVQAIGFGVGTAVLVRTPQVQASGATSYGPLQQSVLGTQVGLFSTTVLNAGVLFGQTEYLSPLPRTSSRGAAENVDVNLTVTPLLPLARLDADSVEANARIVGVCGQLEGQGTTELVGARVTALGGGIVNLPLHPLPNTIVDLGVLNIAGVRITLNKQVQSGNGFNRSLTVTAIHIEVSASVLLASLSGDIEIGQAQAALACADGDGPDLVGSKSMAPNPGTVGQPVTFTLGVANTGNQTATGVQMVDTLDPSFTFQSVTAGSGGACSRNGQIVTCSFASLAPGANGSATLVVVPTQAGNFSNGLNTGFGGPDVDPGDDDPVIPVVIVPATLNADFALGMNAAPSPATVGLPLSYTLTVTNTGPDAANAQVSDALPAGLTLQSASASNGGTCNSGNPVQCSWTAIPNGGVRSITIVAIPTQSGTVSNTATVTAGGAIDPDPSDNSVTLNTQVNPAPLVADLSISKSASPSPAIVGQPLTYTLSVSNAGPDAAAGSVSDTLPAGLTLVSANASNGGSCSGTTTVICSWSSIASGATHTATLLVTPTQAGSLVNTAVIATAGGAGDPDPTDNSSTVTTQVNPAPIVADFSVTKSASPNPATVGQPLTYTILVSNAGPNTASASISDALPGQVSFTSASASNGGNCSGSSTIICNWTGIPAGATRTATIIVVPTLAGSLSNTVAVSHTGGGSDPDPSDDNSTVVTTVNPAPILSDFSVSKTATPNPATVGQPLTYTITVRNAGRDTAGARITDVLAGSVSLTSATASDGGSCTGTSTVVCTWTAIPSNGTRTATLVVLPGQAGPLSNTVAVAPTGGAGDPDPGDDTSTITTPVNPAPIVADFSVLKSANPNPATVGQALTYTLTVTNHGPDAAAANVTDVLPASVSLTASNASNGGSCNGGATVVCSWSAIPAGATRTATLVVIPSQAGNLNNTAVVGHTGGGTDPDPGDDTFTITTPVNPAITEADFAMAMSAAPNPGTVGQPLSYTITVNNTGPSAAGANVSDILPSGVNFTSASASDSGQCAGTSTVICSWGNIPVGGIRTMTLVVTPTQPGTVSNTATVSPTGGASDPDPSDNSATVQTPVDAAPIVANLGIGMTASPNPAFTGQPLTFNISVQNAGPDAAGATVTDVLPGNVSFSAVSASDGGNCAGTTTVTCTWTTIPAAAIRTMQLTVLPSAPGTVTNTATVATSGGATDPNPGNNSATVEVAVAITETVADFGVTGTVAPNPGTVGQPLTYTFTVSNAGPNSASARLVDVLPASLVFGSAAASSGGSCTHNAGQVACDWSSVPANATRSVTLVVTPGSAGPVSNSASVTGGAIDTNNSNNNVTVQANVQAALGTADLGVQISANPNPVTVNSDLTYTVTVSNAGPDATAARLTDALPASFTLVSATASQGGACAGSSTVQCTWASIASGQSRTATLVVRPGQVGSVINTASVASTDGSQDPNPANNSASSTVQVNPNVDPPRADLGVTLGAQPQPAIVGQPLTLSFSVQNSGPDASGVSLSGVLPASFAVQAINASAGGNCTGSSSLVCTWSSVSAGNAVQVLISVLPGTAGSFTRTATVATVGNVTDPSLANNSASQSVQVNMAPPPTPVANLRTVVRALPETLTFGGELFLQVEVFNQGPDAAAIHVSQNLSSAFSLLEVVPGAGGNCSVGNCQFPATASGSSVRISLRVSPTRTGSIGHIATASPIAPASDPDLSDNTGSATVTVGASATPNVADLSVEKMAVPADPVVGAPVDYLLTVRNLGPDQAVGPIVVTDTLPANLRPVSVSASGGGTCAFDGNRVRCEFAGLGNGQSATASLLALANAPGVLRNNVSVSHPNTDNNLANNNAFADVDVRAPIGFAADGSQCEVTRKLTTHDDPTFAGRGKLRYGGADVLFSDQPNGRAVVFNQPSGWAPAKVAVAGDGDATQAQLLDVSRNGRFTLVRSNRDLARGNAELAAPRNFLVEVGSRTARALPAEVDGALLPVLDGQGGQLYYLLASEGGLLKLNAYDTATGAIRTVRTLAGATTQVRNMVASNSGGQLALTASINPVGENADGSVEVFRITAANGEVRQVTAGTSSAYQLGGFDGAGDRLAWIGDGQVQVHDARDGTRALTTDGSAKSSALLTQNGQRVVYVGQSGPVAGSDELMSIAVQSPAAEPVRLTAIDLAASASRDRLLSHDGSAQRFLLASRRPLLGAPANGSEQLYVVDCDPVRSGAWFNPERSGHGFAIQRTSDGLAVLWYTYDAEGQPTWYIASGPRRGKSWQSELLDVRFDAGTGNRTLRTIGTLALSFVDSQHAVAQWTIDGNTGFERIQFLEFSTDAPAHDDTGVYFDPANPGWGLSVSEQGGIRFLLAYLYDQQGRPVWVEGQTDRDELTGTPARIYRGPGLCPVGCSETAPAPTQRSIGEWRVAPRGDGVVEISTSFLDDTVLQPIQWVRATTDFQPLAPLSP